MNKSIRSSISLPEDDYISLQVIADNNKVSLSWLVRKAVRNFLEDADEMKLFNSMAVKKRIAK